MHQKYEAIKKSNCKKHNKVVIAQWIIFKENILSACLDPAFSPVSQTLLVSKTIHF